ncbi:phospholipase A [Parahaliea mediterranea]|uniref:phospholipase A n=1 Tax=Parahaliea mediterranea TaxID=651086 RepID=UPI001300B005|nr:phospholipase A [Parahaliea mediterranea]
MRFASSFCGRGIFPLAVLLGCGNSLANSEYEDCLLDRIANGDPDSTLSDIRNQCTADTALFTSNIPAQAQSDESNSISRRIRTEMANRDRGYTMTPHHPNYLLPYTYNSEAEPGPFRELDPDATVDEDEAMIQVSVKFPVAIDLWDSNTDLMIAYTNRAWWQVFNDEFSKPFRETNYEPEVFFRHYQLDEDDRWYVPEMFDVGYNHQSNGREEPLSRSWDRIFATGFFQLTPNLALSLRTWYRLPENDDEDELAGEYRYLGYGDGRAVYTFNKHTFTLMARPGTEKVSVETTWSYPIANHVRLMLYYFHGYGETLLDYDKKSNRVGIGFAINDYIVNR